MTTRYEITTIATGQKVIVNTLEEVALIVEVDADEIAWAIEEEGYGSTDEYRVVEVL